MFYLLGNNELGDTGCKILSEHFEYIQKLEELKLCEYLFL